MGEEKADKKQRKLSNVFVNAEFQTKIIMLVAGVALMQGVATTGFIFIRFSQFLKNEMTIFTDSGNILEAVEHLGSELLVAIIVANVGFFLFALFMGVYFSHKLAGPNYAIKQAITKLLDGVEHHKINLRKGDEFHDLAIKINHMFSEYHLVKKEKK